jgi:mono/diheme cytochrome c family protein
MLRAALTLSILAILLSGCSTDNSSALDAETYGAGGSSAVNKIFTQSCGGTCHSFQSMSGDQLAAAGLIVKGDPLNSQIYYRLIGSTGGTGQKNMPLVGAPLTSDQIATIQAYITGLH